MCWSNHYQLHSNGDGDGDPLTITAFFVRLSSLHESVSKPSPIPDSLTLLLHLPLNNNNPLEIDNKIPPHFPATVSLRRLRLPNAKKGDVIFGSKQRVHATTQALSFQLYFGEDKLLKGAFRREDHHHHLWKLDLECYKNKSELHRSISISEAEVWVGLDGQKAMNRRVGISNPEKPVPLAVNEYKKRNDKHRSRNKKLELQDIPEETELRIDTDTDVADPETEIHLEMDLEGLRKAFDMGVWVLCLGFALGYMVSRTSIANFRPRPTFS